MKNLLGIMCGVFSVLSCNALPLQVQEFTFTPMPCTSTTPHAQLEITAHGGASPYTFQLFDITTNPRTSIPPTMTGTSATFILSTDHNAYLVTITDHANKVITFTVSSDLANLGAGSRPLMYDIGPVQGTFTGPDCNGNLKLTVKQTTTVPGVGKIAAIETVDAVTNLLQQFNSNTSLTEPFTPGAFTIPPGSWRVLVKPNSQTYFVSTNSSCNVFLSFSFSNPNDPFSLSAHSTAALGCGKKGSIEFATQNGVGPYRYNLFDSKGTLIQSIPKQGTLPNTVTVTSGTFSGLANGKYEVSAVDTSGTGCTVNAFVTVNNACPRVLLCCGK
jgi:hypothetical protein